MDDLYIELSINKCNDKVRALVGDVKESYRAALKSIRSKLQKTRYNLIPVKEWVSSNDELLTPLLACCESSNDCGMSVISEGFLKNTVLCFHSIENKVLD